MVPRCTVIHLTCIASRGTTGGKVAKPNPTKPRTLSVNRSFEPSRVAPACFVNAYERVLPVTRRTLRAEQSTKSVPHRGTKHRQRAR